MADRFEVKAKLIRAKCHFMAADILDDKGLLEQASAMHWISLRTYLFFWLEKQNVHYAGTSEALVAAMSDMRLREVAADLAFAYTIGTISEWDEQFTISRHQFDIYRNKCENVRRQLI